MRSAKVTSPAASNEVLKSKSIVQYIHGNGARAVAFRKRVVQQHAQVKRKLDRKQDAK